MTTPVTIDEIIELLFDSSELVLVNRNALASLAERIKQHGIAQESQEAVAWEVTCGDNRYYVDSLDDAQLVDDLTNHNATYKALSYTTPPSVDALIAEIDEWRTRGVDTYPTMTEILDKYRGVK